MEILEKTLDDYCSAFSGLPSEQLYHLERETHLKTLAPQMMSGALQGQFLYLMCQIIQARSVLEIGTFTGYAAICLAKGMPADGILHTIEANKELGWLIRKYLKLAQVEEKVQLHLGDAFQIIPKLTGPFDLVFLDAGKRDYGRFYDLIFDRVRPGGLILADNVLWSGKVITPERWKDADTRILHAFNQKIKADTRVEPLILPLRDGLMLVRKK
ncbi:MAG TPA: O-methyltransferase [Saprospiraceae bacterium]|nr:O-methyltransferase [Saprospiraceae bacterium]HMQ82894.1 O-methyltransferase [Saprospiraceae bacterium]